MNHKLLYNQKNKKDLLKDIQNENFNRTTLSFYRYVNLNNLQELRDKLFLSWSQLKILGRVYIANEGINAQISIPKKNITEFKKQLSQYEFFKKMAFKTALDTNTSFLKLTIKIKKEIVAYGVSKDEFDITKTGKHLNYKQFNDAIDNGAIIIDMRNYYEGEVGNFENAIIPDVDRSKDLLPEVKKLLVNHKNDKILMYCTGGIRCEKASSYLINHGFKDVNQLKGGIIEYANQIKKNNVKSKFIGKNFVFDNRMGERVTDDILSSCHLCNASCDTHTNCKNQACHILFIQCTKCTNKLNGCCSEECAKFILLPIGEQKAQFKSGKVKFTAQKSNSIKPKLNNTK